MFLDKTPNSNCIIDVFTDADYVATDDNGIVYAYYNVDMNNYDLKADYYMYDDETEKETKIEFSDVPAKIDELVYNHACDHYRIGTDIDKESDVSTAWLNGFKDSISQF